MEITTLPTDKEFEDIAKLLALKQRPDGSFTLGHWERGRILYDLVREIKPRNILEFGTGRGYGSYWMAKASVDGEFLCDIWSIDRIHPSEYQRWPIDEGQGPKEAYLRFMDVWDAYVKNDFHTKFHFLTGRSDKVMACWCELNLPKIDFCFIDGGHDYMTVKMDFINALKIANAGCGFLFDDYADRRGYGVHKLCNQIWDERPYGVELIHGNMALIHDNFKADKPLCQFYSPYHVWLFKKKYQLWNLLP